MNTLFHMNISQMNYIANELTGSYAMVALAIDDLIIN